MVQHVSAEATVRIAQHARAPVLRGRRGDLDLADAGGLPPFERAYFGESELADEILYALRNDDQRRSSTAFARMADDAPKGWEIQMIHVCVRQQNRIDGRQVFDADAGTAEPMDENKPVREDGIDENVASVELQKKRCVADEGDS